MAVDLTKGLHPATSHHFTGHLLDDDDEYGYEASRAMAVASALPQPIPSPPVVPSQSHHGYGHGNPCGVPTSQQHRQQQLQQQISYQQQKARIRHNRSFDNPIWLSDQFKNYRKKQADKEDKSGQKWPEVLENAFLDALLLIPQIGRKKFVMNGKQLGRNMLIQKYLWVSYCQTLPPGVKSDESMRRGRKQVSSHIQVLKNFFIHHRCYHFFFPSKEGKEDGGTKLREDEWEAIKQNPVLIALSEERLPDEFPNYEYFSRLLMSDEAIALRPKTAEFFIANHRLQLQETEAGSRCVARHMETGETASSEDYPHLDINLSKDRWSDEQKRKHGVFLHELAQSLEQRESNAVRELQQQWDRDFPVLGEALHQVTSGPTCDILHFHSALLFPRSGQQLPQDSDLNCRVEMAFPNSKKALLDHHWKVITRLVAPCELSGASGQGRPGSSRDQTAVLHQSEQNIEVEYMHRSGCNPEGKAGYCTCGAVKQRRSPYLSIPYPVHSFPGLMNPAESSSSSRDESSKGGNRSNRTTGGKKIQEHKAYDSTSPQISSHLPQADQVRGVAMMQELWSCSPKSPTSIGSSSTTPPEPPGWERRSVLLWTFETNDELNRKGKNAAVDAGKTFWRFMTAVDPTSQEHQQHAVVSSSMVDLISATAMTPAPSLMGSMHQTLDDGLNDDLSHVWEDNALSMGMLSALHGLPAQMHQGQLLGNYSSGLATPPLTATVNNSQIVHPLVPFKKAGSPHTDLHDQSGAAYAVAAASVGVSDSDPFLPNVYATSSSDDNPGSWGVTPVTGTTVPERHWPLTSTAMVASSHGTSNPMLAGAAALNHHVSTADMADKFVWYLNASDHVGLHGFYEEDNEGTQEWLPQDVTTTASDWALRQPIPQTRVPPSPPLQLHSQRSPLQGIKRRFSDLEEEDKEEDYGEDYDPDYWALMPRAPLKTTGQGANQARTTVDGKEEAEWAPQQ